MNNICILIMSLLPSQDIRREHQNVYWTFPQFLPLPRHNLPSRIVFIPLYTSEIWVISIRHIFL